MWKYPIRYAVIVIGAGHAGCEAAAACVRMGVPTLLLTMNLDTIGKMSCNPAIGGVAKGQIVREISAFGGLMPEVIDVAGIHYRMLNSKKGPAVWSPRAQADKLYYQTEIKHRLEQLPLLDIKQGTIEDLIIENDRVAGVLTKEGILYPCDSVVLSSGTFLRGLLHIGATNFSGGRAGDSPSVGLSSSLEKYGLKLGRLKTGTPPRVNKRSIDYSQTEEQPGEEGIQFSYEPLERPRLPQISCHITHTTFQTKDIVLANTHRSPMYSGQIKGIGTRYCPSIEDKYARFPKEEHQIFLEPEGLTTEEVYVNGVSSSLPVDVQEAMIHSIRGLENAKIMRFGYAIEYDFLISGQMNTSLECKTIEGLFFAGQINGTSGYEEAAGQGLIAGINAANKVLKQEPLILKRSDGYIGVMIDDLVTKEHTEPYRMFTSRAEYRLRLRQDNCDLRLSPIAYKYNLISEQRYARVMQKQALLDEEIERLGKLYKQIEDKNYSIAQLLKRPENSYEDLQQTYPVEMKDFGKEINALIKIHLQYAGYLEREEKQIAKMEELDKVLIPPNFDYQNVIGLKNEARQKLQKLSLHNLGQVSRVAGISPADIGVLLVALSRFKATVEESELVVK